MEEYNFKWVLRKDNAVLWSGFGWLVCSPVLGTCDLSMDIRTILWKFFTSSAVVSVNEKLLLHGVGCAWLMHVYVFRQKVTGTFHSRHHRDHEQGIKPYRGQSVLEKLTHLHNNFPNFYVH